MDIDKNKFTEEAYCQSLPLITFAIFAYNHERFISEAIEGALSQTYSPLEIILSDDCSSDRTFEIMSRMTDLYRGHHRIILNRNEKNLGIGGHVNRIMELSKGELIVAAAGDDISLPERVSKIYETYKASGESAISIFSNNIIIDMNGEKWRVCFNRPPEDVKFLPETIVKEDFILTGCSHAWSREVFNFFGPLAIPLTCEDMVIPFRSALIGQIRYIHEELVMYRRHDANTWQASPKDTPKDYNKWTLFRLKENLAIYRNWLKDLDRFEVIFPTQHDRIGRLRKTILERMTLVKDDLNLIESSWTKKAILLLREFKRGTPVRLIRYRIGVFLVPTIYNKYMKIKNARR